MKSPVLLLKKPPILVLASLVLTGIALFCFIGNRSLRDGDSSLASTSGGMNASAASNPGQLPVSAEASHPKNCAICATGKPDPAVVPLAAVLPRGFFDGLTVVAKKIEVPLPDGKIAVGVVERFEVDAEGFWVMTEGRLTEPAEGRFLFRRQPEGTPSGRYVGAIRFPTENYGYLLGDNAEGEPQLTHHDANGVSCVHYPAPAARIPLADEDAAEKEQLLPYEHPDEVPIPDYQNGVIPLQSLPGAVGVIYLDFDGEEGPHNGWGDFDAAPSGAGNPQIIEVWSRVAEDFSPYDINVTTDLQVYLNAPEISRQRCIITPTNNAAPGAGGVAYLGSWNWSGDTPCWAFYTTGKAAAEVVSHEIGHTLGLAHDGQNPNVGYYGGHGGGDTGWAPIMGVGYYQNLTQWSKGEYLNANEIQDDLAIIDTFNAVNFRADDQGDDAAGAGPLELFNTTVNDDGVIGTRGDVDVFSFTTTGGNLNLSIKPMSYGPNLDLKAELRNSSNVVIASSNPDVALDATLNLNLAAGNYTLHVDGVGRGVALNDGYTDYGSLGHYAIDGTIIGAIPPDRFAIGEYPPMETVVGTVTLHKNHGANPLTYSILSGNTGGAFLIGASDGTLTVGNPSRFNHDLLSNGWNDPAEFELSVQVTDSTQPALNETLRVVVTVNDTGASAPVILAHRYSFTSDATDSVGTANLTLVGGAGISGGRLNLPGGATRTNHASAQGPALAELADTVHGSIALTIEGWFSQDTAQNWAKVFMAGVGSGSDYMDVTPRRDTDGNVFSMSIRNDGDAESKVIGDSALANATPYYFAAIWDGAANRMTLHLGPVGGSLVTRTASMNGRSLADIGIGEFYLGSAVYWGDPDFDGQIDEFRIWNGALGDGKVAVSFAAGPNPAGDGDLDGLPDAWELSFPVVTSLAGLDGNLSAGGGPGAGTGDFDGDGLSDSDEYNGGVNSTNPTLTDTDNDGFPDLLERNLGTDPTDANDKPQPRLAHRYSFNSDASDVVGSADLTLIGTAAVTGGALELPGGPPRTNHATALGSSIGELAATINEAHALTIEAWFNQDTAQNWAKLVMAGKGSDFNYMDITPRRLTDGNVSSISIRTGTSENFVAGGVSGTPLINNTKYYCAATWNPLTDQLVLNIGPVGGTISTHTASMGGQELSDIVVNEFHIGAAVQWEDPDLDGQVDEVRVWTGALSSSEIAAHFAAGPGQPAGDLDEDGLPDEWEFSFGGVNHLDDLGSAGNFDSDGLSDAAEHAAGTNPADGDTDNDGFGDGLEVSQGSDPNNPNDVPEVPPTVLAHRYSFGMDASDAVGNADLTLVGGAQVNGGALDLPGGAPRTNHAAAQGAALAEIGETVQGAIAVSMEGWFRQETAQNWSKLFMAGKGSGGEYLDITPRRGTSGNVSSISFNDGPAESTAIGGVDGGPLAIHTDYYCAAVWDAVADRLTLTIGPVGGALSTYSASLGGRSLSAVAINEFHLGAAVQFPDQDFDGRIDEFRVWRGALSPADIEKHFALGPDQVDAVPVVDSVAMSPTNDTFTLNLSGLLSGQSYHLQSSATLQGFVPVAGSEFVASGGTQVIHVAVNPAAVPTRFFRLAEGPIPVQ